MLQKRSPGRAPVVGPECLLVNGSYTKTQTKEPRKHMNRLSSLKPQWRASLVLAVMAVAIYALSAVCLPAADPTAEKDAKAQKQTEKKAEKKKFMVHMRVRANLPADQAKMILKYLQEDSGKP